jgi:hypothetical protein
MPFLDNREPAVYVDVQDNSLVVRISETGRIVLSAFVSSKGQHRRVIDISAGTTQLHQEFGIPDLSKTNLAYYEFSNAIAGGARGLAIRVTPDDAYLANVIIKKNNAPLKTVGVSTDFTFVENSTEINVDNSNWGLLIGDDDPNKLKIGDWIYSNDGTDTPNDIRQIISIDSDTYKLILNDPYVGSISGWSTKDSAIYKYSKYTDTEESALWDTKYTEALDLANPNDTVYEFIAKGAGAYYNKLKLKGIRNTNLEKMYVDSDGNPLYPFLFMDLALYEEKDNGQDSLLEGPWTVSLVNNLDDGRLIVSLEGQQLYIEDMINTNSEYIICQSGYALGELMSSSLSKAETEKNRKLISLLFSSGAPVGTNLFIPEGNALQFRNGQDGQ